MTLDQSIRVEETGKDTIIAICDKIHSYSLRIKSKDKRAIQSYFRKIGKPNVFPIATFAISVFLLIRHFKLNLNYLIIDNEYLGHESTIKNIILTLFRQNFLTEPNIYFSNIGKHDPAHITAINIHRGKDKEDFILKDVDLIKSISRVIKKAKK